MFNDCNQGLLVHSFLKRRAFFMQMEYNAEKSKEMLVIHNSNTIFQLRTKLNST